MSDSINDDVRRIVEELDADGQGFRTAEAASRLVEQYVHEGVCNGDGEPKGKVRQLMRLGAGVKFKNYRADSQSDKRRQEQARAWAGSAQRDFAEDHDDFAFEWLRVYSAWDEGEDAERKMLIRMTLYEVLDVIELKRKKAAEAIAVANELQAIVDKHPDWHDHPELTVADILDIHE